MAERVIPILCKDCVYFLNHNTTKYCVDMCSFHIDLIKGEPLHPCEQERYQHGHVKETPCKQEGLNFKPKKPTLEYEEKRYNKLTFSIETLFKSLF